MDSSVVLYVNSKILRTRSFNNTIDLCYFFDVFVNDSFNLNCSGNVQKKVFYSCSFSCFKFLDRSFRNTNPCLSCYEVGNGSDCILTVIQCPVYTVNSVVCNRITPGWRIYNKVENLKGSVVIFCSSF